MLKVNLLFQPLDQSTHLSDALFKRLFICFRQFDFCFVSFFYTFLMTIVLNTLEKKSIPVKITQIFVHLLCQSLLIDTIFYGQTLKLKKKNNNNYLLCTMFSNDNGVSSVQITVRHDKNKNTIVCIIRSEHDADLCRKCV